MKPSSHVETLRVGAYVVTRTLERKKEEMKANPLRSVDEYVTVVLARMVGDSKKLEAVLNQYPIRKNLSRQIAILDGHGYRDLQSGEWMYRAGPQGQPVQSWVSSHDGTYGVLMVHVCNPEGQCAASKRSLLLYPEMSLSFANQQEHGRQVNVYVHEFGVVDPNDYRLERFLNGCSAREAQSDRRGLLF